VTGPAPDVESLPEQFVAADQECRLVLGFDLTGGRDDQAQRSITERHIAVRDELPGRGLPRIRYWPGWV
jgi:hypothetical protein